MSEAVIHRAVTEEAWFRS